MGCKSTMMVNQTCGLHFPSGHWVYSYSNTSIIPLKSTSKWLYSRTMRYFKLKQEMFMLGILVICKHPHQTQGWFDKIIFLKPGKVRFQIICKTIWSLRMGNAFLDNIEWIWLMAHNYNNSNLQFGFLACTPYYGR